MPKKEPLKSGACHGDPTTHNERRKKYLISVTTKGYISDLKYNSEDVNADPELIAKVMALPTLWIKRRTPIRIIDLGSVKSLVDWGDNKISYYPTASIDPELIREYKKVVSEIC